MVNMTQPNNKKEVRLLIDIVKYYWDMWSIRSHLLHTLTALTSNKVKFKWTDTEQKALNDIKRAVGQDNLLSYPDFNDFFISIQTPAISI